MIAFSGSTHVNYSRCGRNLDTIGVIGCLMKVTLPIVHYPQPVHVCVTNSSIRMRTLCLLLLVACVNASLLNWEKVRKLKKTLSKLEAHLDVDRLMAIRNRLASHLKVPKLNPQQQTLLDQKLKSIRPAKLAKSDTITEVNEESGLSEILYQGDIVLTEEQAEELIQEQSEERERRQAYVPKSYKWPNNRLYFSFYPNTSAATKAIARKGAKFWHDNTCIDMIEKSSANARVAIYEGTGCSSNLGHLNRLQNLSLNNPGCTMYWKASHELAHALGLHHVQTRYDRDNYLKVDVKNIPEDKLHNFAKTEKSEFSTYNIPYDFGSRMHYGAYDFAKDSSMPSMIPNDKNYLHSMGSPFMSFYDILLMNTHYGCLEKCKSVSSAAKCKNGGYPNPRDCSKCICPRGYGGVLCNERPQASSCGRTETALNKKKEFKLAALGSAYTTVQDDFMECFYWIKNPEKKTVKLTIKGLKVGYVNVACNYGGIEIKSQKNQLMSGYRFCDSNENKGKVISSTSSIIPIIAYSRYRSTEFEVEYYTECKSGSPVSHAKCKNDGYPNPDCSKCICPHGYDGVSCNERPQARSCGRTETALNKKKEFKLAALGSAYTTVQNDFMECYYWIMNPEKKTVKVTIKGLAVGRVDDACTYGGIEIKSLENQLWNGYKICDPKRIGLVISSSNSIIPIIAYSRYRSTEFEVEYYTECKSGSPVSHAKCKNDGYPNPDCSKCICPHGYDGVSCNERPQARSCGRTETALNKKKTFKLAALGSAYTTVQNKFMECYYWIMNPEKKTVKVTIKGLTVGRVDDACTYGGIEIKSLENQLWNGYKICDPKRIGLVISSSNSIIPIIAYSRYKSTEFEVEYYTGKWWLFPPADLFQIDEFTV
ncbi:unnamed protein product [Cylicocyclus nassatus]|uniref:Metalloendopeptidase n=1 Tax=Cylicocyclus nassatus TaxID=53992 RepID=A0AA36GPR1_CYLNA|nr:unnamed protein product [Cylicocyclus nassatus]